MSRSASHRWREERRIDLKVCAELKWSKISLASAASMLTLGARTSDALCLSFSSCGGHEFQWIRVEGVGVLQSDYRVSHPL